MVDRRARNLADGSKEETQQTKQLEVFQAHTAGCSVQVIRSQTSTTSSWHNSSVSHLILSDVFGVTATRCPSRCLSIDLFMKTYYFSPAFLCKIDRDIFPNRLVRMHSNGRLRYSTKKTISLTNYVYVIEKKYIFIKCLRKYLIKRMYHLLFTIFN